MIIAYLRTGARKGVIATITNPNISSSDFSDKNTIENSVLETSITKAFNKATNSNLTRQQVMSKHFVNIYDEIKFYDDDKSFNLGRNLSQYSLYHNTEDYIFIEENSLTSEIDSKKHNRVVSIDFETASGKRATVCCIGYVVEENGVIIHEDEILVNPKAEFSPFSICVHGITPYDVEDAPTWDEAWKIVESYITPNTLVIAHNLRSMELSCIRKECERYDMNIPEFAKLNSKMVYDTLRLSKGLIKDVPNYRLDTLCDMFNIELEHHKALSDARACLQLFNKLKELGDISTISDTYIKPKNKSKSKTSNNISENLFVLGELKEDHILINKKFCITGGKFNNFTRKSMESTISELGAILNSAVSSRTDFLVISNSPSHSSSKFKKALELQEKGSKVKILSEDDFLELIECCSLEKCESNI